MQEDGILIAGSSAQRFFSFNVLLEDAASEVLSAGLDQEALVWNPSARCLLLAPHEFIPSS